MGDINRMMLRSAGSALKDSGASAVILFVDALDDWEAWKRFPQRKSLVLVTQDEEVLKELRRHERSVIAVLRLPKVKLTRLAQIKLSTVMCITEGYIRTTDRIVCLTGPPGGPLDTLIILDLERESEVISTMGVSKGLLKKIKHEVFETALNIAIELSDEGREGRAIGTTFVIGDTDRVMELSRPLIMNPFKGYPEEVRNLLDDSVHETIKEFALLDGAFIIREDGVVMAAGMHLDASLEDEGLTPGLGCRHMAAAGITDVTDAVSITISGSTGIVRIFKNGKTMLEIERPGRGGGGEKAE